MTRTSSFFRLFLANFLLVAVIIALGMGLAYTSLNRHYLRQLSARQADALRFARQYLQAHWPETPADLGETCRDLLPAETMQLTVYDLRGKLLGSNDRLGPVGGNPIAAGRPEMLAALDGRIGRDARYVPALNGDLHYLAAPVVHDGKPVGLVRVAMARTSIYTRGGFLAGLALWTAGITLLSAGALALVVHRIWSRPLRSIIDSAQRIASGSLTGRTAVRGPGELAELAQALNDMRRTVSKQLDLITEQGENLQTILANLQEGVIALGPEGQVVFMNANASALLAASGEGAAGKHFQAVVRVAELVDVYNELMASAGPLQRQIDLVLRGKRTTLTVHASHIDRGGTSSIASLVVIHDITDLARTSSMKAEFVANASHELRTPLATIRAAVDNLVELGTDDPQAVQRLVSMLDRHVSRLEDMTHDLLDLHTAEARQLPPRWEDVELGTLVWWAQTHFTQRAREKNVRLDVEADPEDFQLRTDRKLVVLILQNLLDNALKFTPPGGEIRCHIAQDDQQAVLTVSDTGCGIPPEDRAKVFDRFFQADTSRTGEPRLRGTGLGLAIVKHSADRLGCSIELDSEVGEGTTVTLRIPSRQNEPSPHTVSSP